MPQFILIAYDGTDAEAQERRRTARQDHLNYIIEQRKKGVALIGLALTNDQGQMIGSVLAINAPDRAAFDAYLANDPYIKGGVWKKYDVLPAALAPTFADLLKIS